MPLVKKKSVTRCPLSPQWPLLAIRVTASPGREEARTSLVGEQGGSKANRPHHGCRCTQSAPGVPSMATESPNQRPVSFPKSRDTLVFTLSGHVTATPLLGLQCPVSPEDLVLTDKNLNMGIPLHVSLLSECLDHASSFYYVHKCVRVCV